MRIAHLPLIGQETEAHKPHEGPDGCGTGKKGIEKHHDQDLNGKHALQLGLMKGRDAVFIKIHT